MVTQQSRKFTRIHFTRKVRLNFDDKDYEYCKLKDLNLTGMYVFGPFSQNIGDTCEVELYQKGKTTVLGMNANARVVWCDEEGLAIQFTSMAYDSYMFLQTTLLYEAENPIYIGLELPEDCPFTIIEEESEPEQQDEIVFY